MTAQSKLLILKQLYDIYDESIASFSLSCRKSCASCCTSHVTLTTLEGYWIRAQLGEEEYHSLFSKLVARASTTGRSVSVTLNEMASAYAKGIPISEEEDPVLSGTCPLLHEEECLIYPLRPFACRSMVSLHRCDRIGYADMDPFIFSLNHVFMQYIEHVDATGYFGHFFPVLRLFEDPVQTELYEKEKLGKSPDGLIPNHILTVLMVPPEHRQRMDPILKKIYQIRA